MPREPDLLPDWFVGGAGKRRLLRALVSRDSSSPPWNEEPPWSKRVLAEAAEVHEKHSVFRHLEVLVLAGLLIEDGDGFRLNEESPLIDPVARYVTALDDLAADPLPPSRGAS